MHIIADIITLIVRILFAGVEMQTRIIVTDNTDVIIALDYITVQ